MLERWPNQEEAFQFAKDRHAVMLDMDMGTGKTKVAIDLVYSNPSIHRVLIVCPKSVMSVWPRELEKHSPGWADYIYWSAAEHAKKNTANKALDLYDMFNHEGSENELFRRVFVIVNYDIVWRNPLSTVIKDSCHFDCVIFDESHRIKSAGSKVSKFAALLGKQANYKYCLSGTPMANSPLDVYGQYRFLDPTIFGTRVDEFRSQYAIMGGPEHNFVVGFKNQEELSRKFKSIAYTCKMSDIKDRIKLPDVLPPQEIYGELPAKDQHTSRSLAKEFIAEVEGGNIVLQNVLQKILRLQQITSGFCAVQDSPMDKTTHEQDLNTVKEDMLSDYLEDMPPEASVVVFCVFKHDIDACTRSALKAKRKVFEMSGRANQLDEWKRTGGVLVVQIQAGAEGVDMTMASNCIYYSLPHSLALFEQSKARVYRPGQTHQVVFSFLLLEHTIDEAMYASLKNKRELIDDIKLGNINFGYLR